MNGSIVFRAHSDCPTELQSVWDKLVRITKEGRLGPDEKVTEIDRLCNALVAELQLNGVTCERLGQTEGGVGSPKQTPRRGGTAWDIRFDMERSHFYRDPTALPNAIKMKPHQTELSCHQLAVIGKCMRIVLQREMDVLQKGGDGEKCIIAEIVYDEHYVFHDEDADFANKARDLFEHDEYDGPSMGEKRKRVIEFDGKLFQEYDADARRH
jgi:hypothetical protein